MKKAEHASPKTLQPSSRAVCKHPPEDCHMSSDIHFEIFATFFEHTAFSGKERQFNFLFCLTASGRLGLSGLGKPGTQPVYEGRWAY